MNMNYVNEQYVILPYVLPIAKILKYVDLVVYVAIRSFNGHKGCFPAYETIAERIGMSRDFVMDAVKRLEAVQILGCERSKKLKKPNRYKFPRYPRFERIPYRFFSLKNRLTIHEMAIMLCLRHVLLGGEQNISISGIADILGLGYSPLYKMIKSLINKGYVDCKHGTLGKKYRFTKRFEWLYDYRARKKCSVKINDRSPIMVG
ncbi:MAG: helix-turn-helix domain-containing protein [Pedobacter sp.]|nr:MAG: helix-turn-helix domain-containing protein [Pedobacter sp.]